MSFTHSLLPACALLVAAAASCAAAPRVVEKLDIAPVWAGHPVPFDLLTHAPWQFVAYYDADRRMTVAWRRLGSDQWLYTVLPSSIGWDSHNYITMAVDDDGILHLSGNMHCAPLLYFRSAKPFDPATFERLPAMVDRDEKSCTYPRFFRGPANEFIFTYRDGRSGSGNQIYNVYDRPTRTWRRLLDKPLTDGQGRMNAYLNGPLRGPDGYFHLCWVWRNTPDCATNHDLSYARSKDLVHWETSAGKAIELPMTVDNAEVVDPVPPGGGMINGNTIMGFDSQKRPVICYHKFDEEGKTQLYAARFEQERWNSRPVTRWDYRWEFNGGGTIVFEIRLGTLTVEPDGSLGLSYRHAKYGSGTIKLDEKTLAPIGQAARVRAWPAELDKVESDFPGMLVQWRRDAGSGYVMRWETLGINRDRPRETSWPPPSMLRLYKIQSTPGE